MGWNEFTNNKSNTNNELAYLDKNTLEFIKDNEFAKTAAEQMKDWGLRVMNDLKSKGLTTERQSSNGTYVPNKMKIEVGYATKWENGAENQIFRENKETGEQSPVYKLTATLSHNNDSLTLFASDNIQDGIVIKNMTAKQFYTGDDGKRHSTKPITAEQIAASSLSEEIKAIASYVNDNLLVQHDEKGYTALQNFAFECNMFFKEHSDKVPSMKEAENGEKNLVSNAWASYKKDEYGERVTLSNHNDKKVIEIGKTSSGQDYAKITDFAMQLPSGKYLADAIEKPDQDIFTTKGFLEPNIAAKAIEYMDSINWNIEQDQMLAYVNTKSQKFLETADNPAKAQAMCDAGLEAAEKLMLSLQDNHLITQSHSNLTERDNIDKAVVNVGYATKYNKDTKQDEEMLHSDGSHIYALNVTIYHKEGKNDSSITFHAKEDIEDGVTFSSVTAKQFEKNGEETTSTFLPQNKISASSLNKGLKDIVDFAISSNLIKEKELSLYEYSVECNKYFTEHCEKVPSGREDAQKGELVNNAYAKYDKENDYVRLSNHNNKITIDIGYTEEGATYAKGTNFDMPLENGGYAHGYINNIDELKSLCDEPNIRVMVSQHMGFDSEREQSKEQAAPKKKAKGKDEYPF